MLYSLMLLIAPLIGSTASVALLQKILHIDVHTKTTMPQKIGLFFTGFIGGCVGIGLVFVFAGKA